MIVTFNSLPSGVAMDSHDEIRAKKQMDRHIKKANDTTNDRITLIDLNLKNKSYTFKVCKNKNLEYGNR
jgi:putative heme iron utilization protein